MGRLAKILLLNILILSAVFVAGLSSAPEFSPDLKNYDISNSAAIVENIPLEDQGEKNSEFWSKFRDSVMPEESDKGKIPNYEKNPPPPDKSADSDRRI